MKKGGGSRKGAAFERTICEQLSLWWTDGKDDSIFWRTHSSGARATTLKKKGKILRSQIGDITAIDSVGKRFCEAFTVSLKNGYKNVSLQDLVDTLESRKAPMLAEWILECMSHCNQAKSVGWLLIVKRNQRKPLVFFPGRIKLNLDTNIQREINQIQPQIQILAKIGKKRITSVIALPLEEFLEVFNRTIVKQMVLKQGE